MKLNEDMSNYTEYFAWLDKQYRAVFEFCEQDTVSNNLVHRIESLERKHPEIQNRAIFEPEKEIARKTYLLCLELKEAIKRLQ